MIRALIVDDEPPARARLRHLLDAASGVTVVGEAGHAAGARELIQELRPDVLFLDIEMPEVRGTTFAASLPEPRPFVVFATAYERYAMDAFACDATDYLLKPVSRAKLAVTLERIRSRQEQRTETDRDVAAASALQADMWPGALPDIPGFDCAAACLPAAGVGGDFYDAFALEGGAWGLLIGDVSGKGMAAGLVATAVQGRVQTAARHAKLAPVPMAVVLNADVYASTHGRRYATMIYATLEAPIGQLQVVNAGHPAALLFGPDDSAPIELASTGPALGLMDVGAFAATPARLAPGGILVAFTDGLSEALDADEEEFGSARVASLVASHRGGTAATLCAALLDDVRRHRGARQHQDDVTLLVVKAVGGNRGREDDEGAAR